MEIHIRVEWCSGTRGSSRGQQNHQKTHQLWGAKDEGVSVGLDNQSQSVAMALRILMEAGCPQFEECSPMIEFLQVIIIFLVWNEMCKKYDNCFLKVDISALVLNHLCHPSLSWWFKHLILSNSLFSLPMPVASGWSLLSQPFPLPNSSWFFQATTITQRCQPVMPPDLKPVFPSTGYILSFSWTSCQLPTSALS